MNILPVLFKDFYKTAHPAQYPKGTSVVYSNMTPRGSRIKGIDKVVVYGIQYFIKEFLIKQFNENFFNLPKEEVIRKYSRRMRTSLGNEADTSYVESLYDLGYLPIEIKALPEGSKCSMRVPVLTIENTHPDFAWVTNMFETLMSQTLWGMMTSASIADKYKQILTKYAKKTSDCEDFVQWQGHDFSMRGMFGVDASMMSGSAHLLSFTGTDTIPAIDFLEEYYNADADKELIGGSIPATEHSVMCFGDPSNEYETYKRLITEVYPSGMVSIVSDTWDYWKILTETLPALKDIILSRDGKLVIRPDSGDPVDIICGCEIWNDPDTDKFTDKWGLGGNWNQYSNWFDVRSRIYKTEAEYKGSIELLWETFGGTINSKGYKQLDPHIGLIYGDSITLERAEQICTRLEAKGFASTNVVLGIGSYTYQYNTRDTFGFAVKATYGVVDGKEINIFKKPKTDNGLKNSAKGLLYVNEKFELEEEVMRYKEEHPSNMLKTVFLNGKILKEFTLQEIRNRLNEQL